VSASAGFLLSFYLKGNQVNIPELHTLGLSSGSTILWDIFMVT